MSGCVGLHDGLEIIPGAIVSGGLQFLKCCRYRGVACVLEHEQYSNANYEGVLRKQLGYGG